MDSKIFKKRICIIRVVFILIFVLLTLRIFIYQYINAKDLKTIAENQYQYKEKVSELNYLLLDCNGKDLLTYSNEYYAVIDPYSFKFNNYYTKKDELYALNVTLKNYNKEYNLDNIDFQKKSEKIKWIIDETTYNKLTKIKGIKGFYIYRYVKVDRENKWWSVENILTNSYKIDPKGQKIDKDKDSLEYMLKDKTANNKYVYSMLKKDVNGNVYKEHVTSSKDNIHIRTTLDKYLQDKIKEILNNEPHNSYEQIGVVLMESDTGKIRAMVQKDDTNPNVNLGISTNHGFFPGSIFKVIVEEAGLETGKISLNKKYRLNTNLSLRYKGHEREEVMDCGEALIQSSNDIYAQIGIDVGIKDIKNFSEKQGFTNKVLNLDEETHGFFEGNDKEAGDVELTSFGQKQRITPIEAISIPNTVINKGVYVKPYIIDSYVNQDNVTIEECNTVKSKVFSETTANILRNQMLEVVKSSRGTGKQAYLNDIIVGGKTGTAEREEGKNKFYDGWFAGFFTIDKKNYSMVVFVKNIGSDKGGGSTAAPIFKEIVQETKEYLNNF